MESIKIRNQVTNEFVDFGITTQPIRNFAIIPEYENQTYIVPNTDGKKFLQKLLSMQSVSFESNIYVENTDEINAKIAELENEGQTPIQAASNAPQIVLYEKYDALSKILTKTALLDITVTRYDGKLFTLEGVSIVGFEKGKPFRDFIAFLMQFETNDIPYWLSDLLKLILNGLAGGFAFLPEGTFFTPPTDGVFTAAEGRANIINNDGHSPVPIIVDFYGETEDPEIRLVETNQILKVDTSDINLFPNGKIEEDEFVRVDTDSLSVQIFRTNGDIVNAPNAIPINSAVDMKLQVGENTMTFTAVTINPSSKVDIFYKKRFEKI